MTLLFKTPRTVPAAMAIVLALGAGIASSNAAETETMPLSCGVSVKDLGRMVELKAYVSADEDAAGTYTLSIEQSGRSGSSSIRQGGGFAVKAGGSATLGQTMLGGDPGNFDIDLILNWNGLKLSCPVQDL
jgi:hypothetical protein